MCSVDGELCDKLANISCESWYVWMNSSVGGGCRWIDVDSEFGDNPGASACYVCSGGPPPHSATAQVDVSNVLYVKGVVSIVVGDRKDGTVRVNVDVVYVVVENKGPKYAT